MQYTYNKSTNKLVPLLPYATNTLHPSFIWQGPELKDGEVLEDSQIEKVSQYNRWGVWLDGSEWGWLPDSQCRYIARLKS